MGSRSIPGDKVNHVNSWIFLDHIWAEYRPLDFIISYFPQLLNNAVSRGPVPDS